MRTSPTKKDLRVTKTLEAIDTSFRAMVLEGDYESVTVKAIPSARKWGFWLDRHLGIDWTGHEKGRTTCGPIFVSGNLHYPGQVLGSGPLWAQSQPACASPRME